MGEWDGEGGLE